LDIDRRPVGDIVYEFTFPAGHKARPHDPLERPCVELVEPIIGIADRNDELDVIDRLVARRDAGAKLSAHAQIGLTGSVDHDIDAGPRVIPATGERPARVPPPKFDAWDKAIKDERFEALVARTKPGIRGNKGYRLV